MVESPFSLLEPHKDTMDRHQRSLETGAWRADPMGYLIFILALDEGVGKYGPYRSFTNSGESTALREKNV